GRTRLTELMMKSENVLRKWRFRTTCRASILALSLSSYVVSATAVLADNPGHGKHERETATPIKHVIILIGENRGLDHTFGVYKPKGRGETISNLLSKRIVNEDGSPGPRFQDAQQFFVTPQSSWYFGAPKNAMSLYDAAHPMPQPNTNGAPSAPSA